MHFSTAVSRVYYMYKLTDHFSKEVVPWDATHYAFKVPRKPTSLGTSSKTSKDNEDALKWQYPPLSLSSLYYY
jgi:hypothetical protein